VTPRFSLGTVWLAPLVGSLVTAACCTCPSHCSVRRAAVSRPLSYGWCPGLSLRLLAVFFARSQTELVLPFRNQMQTDVCISGGARRARSSVRRVVSGVSIDARSGNEAEPTTRPEVRTEPGAPSAWRREERWRVLVQSADALQIAPTGSGFEAPSGCSKACISHAKGVD
jgi:hypothetical protein